MQNLSQNQLLDVWSELMLAYCGKNGFGSDTAEIYAYALRSDTPCRYIAPEGTEMRKSAIVEGNRSAAQSLVALCLRLEEKFDCRVYIDGDRDGGGLRPKEWLKTVGDHFEHRAHVRVEG